MSDGLVGSAPPWDVAPATCLSPEAGEVHYVGLYLREERCVRMATIHVDEILCLTILFSFFFQWDQGLACWYMQGLWFYSGPVWVFCYSFLIVTGQWFEGSIEIIIVE